MQQICLLCNGIYIDSCFLGFQCYPTLQNLKSSSIIILSSKSIQPPSIVKGGKVVGHFHVNIARQTHYSERVNMQGRLSSTSDYTSTKTSRFLGRVVLFNFTKFKCTNLVTFSNSILPPWNVK